MQKRDAVPAHLAELLDWHRDEISAQAMFEELAQAAGDPDCARKWRALARLEAHVATRLQAALAERGVRVPSPDVDQAHRTQAGNPYLELSWREAMEHMRPWLARYVDDFSKAESRMPADLLPLARFVAAHEQALLDFVTRELDRGGYGSLESVQRVLEATP